MPSWIRTVSFYCFLLFQGANEAVRMAVTMEACGKLNHTLLDNSPVYNPLECLQRCNTSKVGIQNTTCVCGNGYNEAPSARKCNQICTWKEKDFQYSCGGEQFSIYTRDIDVENNIGVHSGCVFRVPDGGLSVANCSRTLPCQCYRAFNRVWEPDSRTEHSWEECLPFCRQNNNLGIFAYNQENKDCPSNGRICRSDYWINTYIYDDCIPNKCLNNGTCTNTESSFTCHCQAGFSGTNCEKDVCYPNPCEHNGSCFLNGTRTSCACRSGYSGEYCRQSLDFTTVASNIYPSESIEETFIYTPWPTLASTLTLALVYSAGHNSSAVAEGTYSKFSSDLSMQLTTSMATSTASAVFSSEHYTGTAFTQSSATTEIMSHSLVLSVPTNTSLTHLTGLVPSSFISVAPNPLGTIHLTRTALASYTEPSNITSASASTAKTHTQKISSPGPFVTSTPAVTFVSSAVTSNPNDAISGWFTDHAIIIFPICGTVVVLLVVTIIIICVRMRKIKRRNDALESENNDTPSNSEFDYKSSYSSIQRPENFYSSYHSGQYTYKEVPRMGQSHQMYLPRVTIRTDGSLPRYNRDYDDHAFDLAQYKHISRAH